MKYLYQRMTRIAALSGAAILLLGAACHVAGARMNTTKSIPVGLYWSSNEPIEKGTYVLFCPPQAGVFDRAKANGYIGAGFCPGGYGYMMKRVVAMGNDVVSIADDGVRVNGELLPLSVPLKTDKGGRPLPRYLATNFILGNAEVLLMSDVSATSFDGRYFGPVKRAQIKTVVMPVVTW